jgi:RNA polymerase sigma factor (sigma-70 family)
LGTTAYNSPQGNDRSDAELVVAAQAGDLDAAELLFARYDERLRREAISATASISDAAEVSAAARALAWEKLASLRNPERFGPWLSTIVRNCAINEQRIRARATPVAEIPEQIHEDDDLVETLERLQRGQHVQRAVSSLSPRDREALKMAVIDDLPVATVASRFGITANATYQLLHRARRRLHHAYLTPVVPSGAPRACRDCADKTAAYVDGSASAGVIAFVDQHVADCEPCNERLAAMSSESERCAGVFVFALPAVIGLLLLRRGGAVAAAHVRTGLHAAAASASKARHLAAGSSNSVAAAAAVTAVAVAGGAVAVASGALNSGSHPASAGAPQKIAAAQHNSSANRNTKRAPATQTHRSHTRPAPAHRARQRASSSSVDLRPAAAVPTPASSETELVTPTAQTMRPAARTSAATLKPSGNSKIVAAGASAAGTVKVTVSPPSVTVTPPSSGTAPVSACGRQWILNCPAHPSVNTIPREPGTPGGRGEPHQPGAAAPATSVPNPVPTKSEKTSL